MRSCRSRAGPIAWFTDALERGDLATVRATAAELPAINLQDALRVALLVCDQEPDRAERAALRWLGRYCLEHRNATLADLSLAVAAFSVMPHDRERAAGIVPSGRTISADGFACSLTPYLSRGPASNAGSLG